jgi:anti-sigma regulatory factor (Ser/Thr protein kinase)
MEELLLNYVEHSGKPQKAYMDISILCDQDEITLIIKDDGIPFDPIHVANEGMKAGLKLVQAFMSDASYNYTLGQNIVIMKWEGMIK